MEDDHDRWKKSTVQRYAGDGKPYTWKLPGSAEELADVK